MKNKTIIAIAVLLTANMANAQSINCDTQSLGTINYNMCNYGQIGTVGNGVAGVTGTTPITSVQNSQATPLAGQVSNAVVVGSSQTLDITKQAQAKLIAQIKAAPVTSGVFTIGGSGAGTSTGIAGGVALPAGTTQAAAVQAYRAAGSAQSEDLAAMSAADYASWVARGGLTNVQGDQSSLYVGMKGYTPSAVSGSNMTGGTFTIGGSAAGASTGIAGGVALPAGTTQAAAVQAYSAAGSAQTGDLAAMSAADYSSWVERGGLTNVQSDQSSLYDGMARNY